MKTRLFKGTSIFEMVNHRKASLRSEIRRESKDKLIPDARSAFVDACVAKFAIQVPKLGEPGAPVVSDGGTNGATATFKVPFTGSQQLFEIAPSVVSLTTPAVEFWERRIQFTYSSRTRDAGEVLAQFNADLEVVREALKQLEIDVHAFNASLRSEVESAAEERWKELASTDAFAAALNKRS